MQKYCTELTEKLLRSLDSDYHVVDLRGVIEVFTVLEKTTLTKEVLEATRLGKHVNELRRNSKDEALARRAKNLVRKWRDQMLPGVNQQQQQQQHAQVADAAHAPAGLNGQFRNITPASPALKALNSQTPALRGLQPQSPALRGLQPQSPAFKGLQPQSPVFKGFKPQSPALKGLKPNSPAVPLLRNAAVNSRISSPALSLHSDQSRSPVESPIRPPTIAAGLSNHVSSVPKLDQQSGQNHLSEAVPRTHSSNKRLRKEDSFDSADLASNKKLRHNGDSSVNNEVPSLTLKERNPELIEPVNLDTQVHVAKKRGRKKGSKSIKNTPLLEDSVKEKLASISRSTKLKTTQELFEDLQKRGSNVNANFYTSHNVSSIKKEDSNSRKSTAGDKYPLNIKNSFEGTFGKTNCKYEESLSKSPHKQIPTITIDEDTVDSVGPKKSENNFSSNSNTQTFDIPTLPPLDRNTINWDEDNYYVHLNTTPRELTDADIDKYHTECVEGLNGNWQPKLACVKTELDDTKDEITNSIGLKRPSDSKYDNYEFREWHEMLARPSFNGENLHILPYVVID
ncbi:mediator of RNA polymerase II transcription subunit 26 [Trichogramma pretiosum]|uniref:mediator of RNA polymerase II transcription subunit 26 n=1 Tax=Trichogramma pretiosum TaxID=7493 RepID=UPI0006C981BD|nr:mediator of RNA polymerase II transcription subunit 26 [Trichogramma pretiosum]